MLRLKITAMAIFTEIYFFGLNVVHDTNSNASSHASGGCHPHFFTHLLKQFPFRPHSLAYQTYS